MGLGDIFKLSRLTIAGFKDADHNDEIRLPGGLKNPLEVMYNPETLSSKFESVFANKVATGPGKTRQRWAFTRGNDLTVKLVFDGTAVSSFGVERLRHIPSVAEQVKNFLALCHAVIGDTHEPSYLRLTWGDGVLGSEGLDCRLQSADIQYTLFDRDGSPLRAELTARFVESLGATKQAGKLRLSSPDLTHRRVVQAGDTLPALCREIYGSAVHYARVARVNDLDDFRNLTPGQALIFPPFARGERS